MEARTENISSQGFYCIATEPIAVGERLECEVEFPRPQWGATGEEAVICLHCVAIVVRVEADHLQQGFGIACRMEDYALRGEGLPTSRFASLSSAAEMVP